MTEAEKLQEAYFSLGCKPGDPLEKIIRRHKRLIVVWHPDRFPTSDGKLEAEEELKQINNARDVLKKHFEQDHSESPSCACRQTANASQSETRTGPSPGPGPGKRKTTQETNREEADAERRTREREAAAAAEAAEKERQRKAAEDLHAQELTEKQIQEQLKAREDERLRWKLSACIGAAWIALSLFGWMGTSLKAWWHDFSWKWERDHAPQQSTQPTPAPSSNNYVPPYQVSPYQNQTTTTAPFGPVGPPPEQSGSQLPALNNFNKTNSFDSLVPTTNNSSQLLPTQSQSAPSFQPVNPNLFPKIDQPTVRTKASDFLTPTNSNSSNSFSPLTPQAPLSTPFSPSTDSNSSFKQKIEELTKGSQK
jgi:curved DNA-binding protein CbpA